MQRWLLLVLVMILTACASVKPGAVEVPPKPQPAYPLEPGLHLTYRGLNREWHVKVSQPTSRGLTPVENSAGGAGYVAVSEGWVWEHGRRDRNGEAFWPAPRKILPAILSPGLSWEWQELGDTYQYTVEAAETVTVAAGTYQAYRLSLHLNGQPFGQEWHAPSVGLVKATDSRGEATAELIRVERGTAHHP